MSNVKAVIFDLWQTLIFDNRELGRDRTRLRIEGTLQVLQSHGYDFTYAHLREAYRECYRICHAKHDKGEDYTFNEQVHIFINNIQGHLLGQLDKQAIDRITYHYAEAFFDFLPPVDPDAYSLLSSLHSQGDRKSVV